MMCRMVRGETKKENNPFFGKHHTNKTKDKIRQSLRKPEGSITIHKGYYYIITFKHPFRVNNRISRCRFNLENYLRKYQPNNKYLVEVNRIKYLIPNIIIHHKNFIKDNDKPKNLQILDNQSQHTSLHNKIQKKRKYKNYFFCGFCKKEISFYSKKCKQCENKNRGKNIPDKERIIIRKLAEERLDGFKRKVKEI